MNIAECLTNSGSGGGQQLVYELVRGIRRFFPGRRITVVLPAGGIFVQRFRGLGVEVRELALDRLSPGVHREFSQVMQKVNPDVVHSHGKGAGLYSRLSGIRAARVHSFHGFHPPEDFSKLNPYVILERALASRVSKYVLVSESEKIGVLRALPHVENRVRVIPNVIDVNEFRSSVNNDPGPEFTAFASQNAGRSLVTMIGRSDPMKNHDLALGAARKILSDGGQFAFAFIGLDPGYPHFQKLKAEYPQHLFATSYSPNVGSIVKMTDIVLHPSRREGALLSVHVAGIMLSTRNYFGEGLPLALLEAQALGKPIVGTNVEGVTDVVEDCVTGLLCEQTTESIAAALARLRNDREVYQKMSQNALEKADASNVRTWVGAYMQMYESVATRGRLAS